MKIRASNYKIHYLLFLAIVLWSCSEDTRTEIIDRWENGSKKRIVTYSGEGENEIVTQEKLFTASGDLFMKINRQKNDTTFFPELFESFNDSTLNGKWKIEKHYIDSSGQNIRTINTKRDSLLVKDSMYSYLYIAKNLENISSLNIQEAGHLKLNKKDQVWMLPTLKTIQTDFVYHSKVFDEKRDVTSLTQKNLVRRNLGENGNIIFNTSIKYDYYGFEDKTEMQPVDSSFFNTVLKIEKDTLRRIVKLDSTKSEVEVFTRAN